MRNVGRFIVVDLLGTGTQGKVYRCRDPKLEREVAIKLLNKPLLHAAGTQDELMQEARAMSRLSHHNCVSVFDVGEHQGRPYIVFELVQGESLAGHLRRQPPDMARALDILDGVLQGVAAAHERDIVHRDIKPANILLSSAGLPKVTDFGIASVLGNGSHIHGQLIGTPRYMAPEYIREGRLMKQSDVFSLGLLAWEILTGRPAYEGRNTERLLHDIVNRPVQSLDQVLPDIDERLRNIVEKALEKDPYLRFEDAGEMRAALHEYRSNAQSNESYQSSHATIEFLLRRMRLKSDFPALSQSISTINKLSSSQSRDLNQLAEVILKDQGLSSKVLRVVNSAYYAAFSGTIATVSRALVILGVNGVRSIAASLSLLDHFGDKSNVDHLKGLLSESLYSGLCAREVCSSFDPQLGEEALLGTMLRRLGEILVAYYLPEEEKEIRRLRDTEGFDAIRAEKQVLGTDYASIGAQVAAEWNFPTEMSACIEGLDEIPATRVPDNGTRLQLVAGLADQATRVLRGGRCEDGMRQMKKLLSSYSGALGIDPMRIVDAIGTAKREYLEFRVNFLSKKEKQRFIESLDQHSEPQRAHKAGASQGPAPSDTTLVCETVVRHPRAGSPTGPQQLLAEGLQEVTRLVAARASQGELSGTVLNVLRRALGLRRLVAAEWRQAGQEVVAFDGCGEGVEELLQVFRARYAGKPNLLTLALIQNSDVYISDATQQSVGERMPPWFRGLQQAPGSFLILPMRSGSGILGMVYAEFGLAYGFDEDSGLLPQVKALRDQFALGFGQSPRKLVAR